jgi:nitrate reductase alpha subunit
VARAEVIVTGSFREYEREVAKAVDRALGRAASVGVAVARSAPSRYQIQAIQGSIHATSVEDRTIAGRAGREVNVVARDYRAVFFESGTLGRRTKKLKRGRKLPVTTSDGKKRGIRPQRFLGRGMREMKQQIVPLLSRELDQVRSTVR